MAYGDNRRQVASALFSNAYGVDRVPVARCGFGGGISGDWSNGTDDWAAFSASGGTVRPTNAFEDALLEYTGVTLSGAQYSKVIVETHSASGGQAYAQMGVVVRHQGGTDTRCYVGYASTGPGMPSGDEWSIQETTDAPLSWSQLTNSLAAANLASGDTLTLEADGSALRLGSNRSGSDVQIVSTTDVTLTAGNPGVQNYEDPDTGTAVSEANAWEGGNIGFGNWENGGGVWGDLQYASGGHIEPTTATTLSSARRTAESYSGNQYSKVTIQTFSGAASIGAICRLQAGADERCYLGEAAGSEDNYGIYEIEADVNANQLAATTDPGGEIPLTTGETVTLEVEGSTLRLGCNSSGSDAQKVTTTDVTLTAGEPGVYLYHDTAIANSQITAWEAGNILTVLQPRSCATGTKQVVSGSYVTSVNMTGITIANQPNRVLYVAFLTDVNVGSFAVTWNGDALTQVGSDIVSGNARLKIFRLVNPDTGNNTLAFSWTTSAPYAINVDCFYNVDQTTPNGTPVTATGSSTAPATGNVTRGDDSIVIGFGGAEDTTTAQQAMVLPKSHYELASNDFIEEGEIHLASSFAEFGSPVPFTFKADMSGDWVAAGLEILPVTAAWPPEGSGDAPEKLRVVMPLARFR